MPKCPNCKKEISYLVNIQNAMISYNMNKEGEYKDKNIFGSGSSYQCPECEENLDIKSKNEALDFLNGAI